MEKKEFVKTLNELLYGEKGVMFDLHDDGRVDEKNAEKVNAEMNKLEDYFEKNDPEILPAVNLFFQYMLRVGLTVGLNDASDDDDRQVGILEEIIGRNVPEWPVNTDSRD